MTRKVPFNLKLPDDAINIEWHGVVIGYAWEAMVPHKMLAKRQKNVGRKQLRWTVCMLDGEIVSRNSRTVNEARRTLRRAIQKRAHPKTK